jgi:hypothetical protein
MAAEDPGDGLSGNQDVLKSRRAWVGKQAFLAAEAGLHEGGCHAGEGTRGV